MDLETETQPTIISTYRELLEHQNELMIDKDNFTLSNYLKTCQLPFSQNEDIDEEEEKIQNPILVKRDKTPKIPLDDEMKKLIKSDLKENLKIVNEAQNMVIK